MQKCISEYYCELTKSIKIYFQLNNITVESINNIENNKNKSEFGYVKISIEANLKSYQRTSDLPVLVRSDYLTALGIVSYLIDEPLDVFNNNSSGYVSHSDRIVLKNNLVIDGANVTSNLNEFINSIVNLPKNKQNLIFSLLDRWRKARYLESESEENFRYLDEATLSYFHILELIGDLFSSEINDEATALINEFVSNFNENILSLSGNALESESQKKSKLIKEILSKDVSVSTKIFHFLKNQNIYSEETVFWVKTLVETRNSIAHGRKVFMEKSDFPLYPFFPLVKNEIYPIEFTRVLSAYFIASYLNIPLYKNEWNIVESFLVKDKTFIKKHLKENNFKTLSTAEHDEEKIINGGVNSLIISKKIKPIDAIQFFKFHLEHEIENPDFLYSNIYSIIILFEHIEDFEVSSVFKTAILNTEKLECNIDISFKDTLLTLDYYGYEANKLELLIINKEIK